MANKAFVLKVILSLYFPITLFTSRNWNLKNAVSFNLLNKVVHGTYSNYAVHRYSPQISHLT